jgi:hypothetical protein
MCRVLFYTNASQKKHLAHPMSRLLFDIQKDHDNDGHDDDDDG